MLTIDQRREMLEEWYNKFGLESLLDRCAVDLQSFALRCRELRSQIEETKNDT